MPGQSRESRFSVPEVRTGTLDIAAQLQQVHDLALWVATLDRYATRDSLEQALGRDNVAILHQERRLGGDSPLSLVLSQKSGGPADRAIGRSLRAAGIVADPGVALSIGTELRQVASQGYGILALQAATSGAGINELVGHVVAFSLLATTTTPWPLPPGCRVLLVSLDEYRHWFPGKRADLLAIALDPARAASMSPPSKSRPGAPTKQTQQRRARPAEPDARGDPLGCLPGARQYPHAASGSTGSPKPPTPWPASPGSGSTPPSSQALEAFRLGRAPWNGRASGWSSDPRSTPLPQDLPEPTSPATSFRLSSTASSSPSSSSRAATSVRLAELRTVETDQPPLQSTRVRRRPEAKANGDTRQQASDLPQPRLTAAGRHTCPTSDTKQETTPPDAGSVAAAGIPSCKNRIDRGRNAASERRERLLMPFARRPASCYRRIPAAAARVGRR